MKLSYRETRFCGLVCLWAIGTICWMDSFTAFGRGPAASSTTVYPYQDRSSDVLPATQAISVSEGIPVAEICQNDGSLSFTVTNVAEVAYYRITGSRGTAIIDWSQIQGNAIEIKGIGSGEYILEIYDRNTPMENPFTHTFSIPDARKVVITAIVKNIQCYGEEEVGWIRFVAERIECGSNNIDVSYSKAGEDNFTSPSTIGLGGGKSEYIKYRDGTINFPPGVYDFRVTQGGANCSNCGVLKYTVTVEGPDSELLADAVITQDYVCSGTVFYEATVYPEGGWGGYTYLWSDGQTTQTASFLSPGASYRVQVTDAGGCQKIKEVPIPGENSFAMNITGTVTDPGCGTNSGTIDISYTGIDPARYTVSWKKDDPEEGQAVMGDHYGINGLSEGLYFLLLSTSKDADCKIIRQFTLKEMATPVTTVQDHQEICEGESVVFTPGIASTSLGNTFHWYFDSDKTDPVLDNTLLELSPGDVLYQINEATGALTVTGLPFGGIPYSFYVEASGENVCESPPGELKEVKIAVNPQPAPPEVNVTGGHPRNSQSQ